MKLTDEERKKFKRFQKVLRRADADRLWWIQFATLFGLFFKPVKGTPFYCYTKEKVFTNFNREEAEKIYKDRLAKWLELNGIPKESIPKDREIFARSNPLGEIDMLSAMPTVEELEKYESAKK